MTGDDRRDRLAKQLRANLKRRKAQSRAKRAGEADDRSGLPNAADDGDAPAPGTPQDESGDDR